MMYCKNCGQPLEGNGDYCNICVKKAPAKTKKIKKTVKTISLVPWIIMVVLCIALTGAVTLTNYNKNYIPKTVTEKRVTADIQKIYPNYTVEVTDIKKTDDLQATIAKATATYKSDLGTTSHDMILTYTIAKHKWSLSDDITDKVKTDWQLEGTWQYAKDKNGAYVTIVISKQDNNYIASCNIGDYDSKTKKVTVYKQNCLLNATDDGYTFSIVRSDGTVINFEISSEFKKVEDDQEDVVLTKKETKKTTKTDQ